MQIIGIVINASAECAAVSHAESKLSAAEKSIPSAGIRIYAGYRCRILFRLKFSAFSRSVPLMRPEAGHAGPVMVAAPRIAGSAKYFP